MLSSAILLGPQRRVKTVCDAVEALVPDAGAGPVAAVTAGWEEREAEDEELCEHVGRTVTNLAIWQRVERIFGADPELFEAIRQRQDTLRKMQAFYRLRLEGLMDPLCELFARDDDLELLEPEREAALAMVQALDREHGERVAAVHQSFEAQWRPFQRDAVVREREAIEAMLEPASCLLVAGGHVGVLLHRLRLFDLFRLWGDRPVVAWSAGAMVLCRRIVLFHDSPPQGSNYPEVLERGFDLVPGIVALPHAVHRLRLDDRRSMQVFASRFAPAWCVLLDRGARLSWADSRWSAASGSRMLGADGAPEEIPA